MMSPLVIFRPRRICVYILSGFLLLTVMLWSGWLTRQHLIHGIDWVNDQWREQVANLKASSQSRLRYPPPKPSVSDKLSPEDQQEPWKTVLFWNTWFGFNWSFSFGPTTPEGLREAGCPSWRCLFSYDRRILSSADAVVVEALGFTDKLKNVSRPAHQRWVWVGVEAPTHASYLNTVKHHHLSPFINWTMTYHSEADIVAFYGHFLSLGASSMPVRPNLMSEHSEALQKLRAAQARGDTLQDVMGDSWKAFVKRPRVVAFMTSHCGTYSRREEYVTELQKYIDVDRYGSCTNRYCGKRFVESTCWGNILSSNYSFYMSMENNLCDEYATEKLYLALVHKMVPVVWGGSDYDRLLPPHSYINTRHYHPRNLARVLLRLHNDPVAYGKYHLWRGYLKAVSAGSFCELCHRLHKETVPSHHQDVESWYVKSAKCIYPKKDMFKSAEWKKIINDTEVTGARSER